MRKTDLKTEKLVCNLYRKNVALADITDKAGVSIGTVHRILERNDVPRNRKTGPRKLLACDENYFETLTKQSAYWLGFIMADGSVGKGGSGSWQLRIKLALKDKDHLHTFKSDIGSDHQFRTGLTKDGHPYCVLGISRKKITDDLREWGVIPNKTKSLSLPEVPSSLFRHYLRGYFDGDGSFYLRKKSKTPQLVFNLRSSTEGYLLQIREELTAHTGVVFGQVYSDPHADAYSLTCEGNGKSAKIFHWMYHNASRFLPRKYHLAARHLAEHGDE